ncbi:MAG TPA: HlyC/CorC family transporter [Gammaproteobacteria bacterium]|jgi:Mg2+/Co2+ transporter CorB|nr:HlyC/CorC family transporter [Gammaproteobacteria bacterium]
MKDFPISYLIGVVCGCLTLSAFFAGSETALMSLNRYRLRHLARAGHRGAQLAEQLLKRPDRLIGLMRLGDTLANVAATSLTTLVALRIGGDSAVAIAGGLLILALLIFSEITPKTLAALYPERFGFPAAYIYWPLLKLLWPVVWVVNSFTRGVLRIMNIRADQAPLHSMSSEELRSVVTEAGALIPKRHQRMLLSILDLEKITAEDIMVPRNEISGIDIEADWDEIVHLLQNSQHTRLPVYEGGIDKMLGFVHARQVLHLLSRHDAGKEALREILRDAYFVPEGTSLQRQLLNFQTAKRRIGLVVDEYGDIQGLVTLEDILEEIVGEFTTDPAAQHKDVYQESEKSYLINGSANVRALNRVLHLKLPIDGPKTLNGLILEFLETIPQPGTAFKLFGHSFEIVQTSDNTVKTVRLFLSVPLAAPKKTKKTK